jgi:hypothetical protein
VGTDLLIAMRNEEHQTHEVHDLPGRSPFVDLDESDDEVEAPEEQWAELVRIITLAQFQMLNESPESGGGPPSASQ